MPDLRPELDDLAAAVWSGAADDDVVAAVLARVDPGDADAWLQEWTAAGGAAWAAARERPSTVRYLHAATYYATALARIADSDGSVDERALVARQRDCWERAIALLPRPGERLDVAGASATFVPAPGGGASRPLVVVAQAGLLGTRAWARGGAAAHARGQHWLACDSALADVLTAAAARPEVDAGCIAVIGLEHAVPGVARLLAETQQIAAAVLAPGILDASTPALAALPAPARTALADGDRAAFDRELHLAELFAPGTLERLRRHARPHGTEPGRPPLDLYDHLRAERLRDEELARITVPVLVCERPDGARWPGQARALYDLLPGPDKELADAAPGDDRVADWIAHVL
jgi:hypothetical protein